jgi:membrane-bound metal-dependent hydrolase YbcI (DUF457 family)
MDTITHGIAGALLGKSIFRGDEMFTRRPLNRGRIITWSLMVGAIFPDADTFRGTFSHNDMLIMTWHRSITHSLLCLPLWALLLAAITRALVRWRNWDAPSFASLTGIYAVGIASHIFLDLATSFGTMIWSPLQYARPTWDLIFIVDFTFSAILLIPQLLAWIYAKPDGLRPRALSCWIISVTATLAIAGIGQIVGAPISHKYISLTIVILAAVFLLPSMRGFGLRLQRSTWNRAGLVLAVAYLVAAFFAHNAALARVKKFAASQHIEVQSLAALPLPPSVAHWDGLILSPHGVYETRINFGSPTADPNNSLVSIDLSPSGANQSRPEMFPIEYSFFPNAPENSFIDASGRLPQVETYFWFARFPVTRFHKEGDVAVVEFSDIRFPHARSQGPDPFTYVVRFDANGKVLSQGWRK